MQAHDAKGDAFAPIQLGSVGCFIVCFLKRMTTNGQVLPERRLGTDYKSVSRFPALMGTSARSHTFALAAVVSGSRCPGPDCGRVRPERALDRDGAAS